MSSNDPKLNMIKILQEGLEKNVKEVLTERLVKEELSRYESRVRTTIEPIVNSISFEGIEHIKDHMRIRDELHVFLNWKGGSGSVEKEI